MNYRIFVQVQRGFCKINLTLISILNRKEFFTFQENQQVCIIQSAKLISSKYEKMCLDPSF